MSDYTKLTAYDIKDSLSTGDPLKRVKGTELDDEFDAIAVAIATKANSASPAFTGTPTAPTASALTSTTQLATTAFVTSALQTLYPVGSIYSSTVSTNPNTLFGFGTWVAFAAGRVMIGNGGGFSAGTTGGSADAIVVSHTHSVTDPSHTHGIPEGSRFGGGVGLSSGDDETSSVNNYSTSQAASTGISIASAGSSGTNANLQPYIVVYMWNRTT
jgi:hypothetical protein